MINLFDKKRHMQRNILNSGSWKIREHRGKRPIKALKPILFYGLEAEMGWYSFGGKFKWKIHLKNKKCDKVNQDKVMAMDVIFVKMEGEDNTEGEMMMTKRKH